MAIFFTDLNALIFMKAGALNGNCDWFQLVVFHLLRASMMTKFTVNHESNFVS